MYKNGIFCEQIEFQHYFDAQSSLQHFDEINIEFGLV